MSNPGWPPELPQTQFMGLTHKVEPNVVVSHVDCGLPKVRRRSTILRRIQKTPIQLTGAQLAIFDGWFSNSLYDGVLPFDWTDFVTGTTTTFRFAVNNDSVSTPQWTLVIGAPDPENRLYESTLELETYA